MILYKFVVQETGEQINKFFKCGQCPKEIVTEDGKKAKRKLGYGNFNWGEGYLPPTAAQKYRNMMTQKNIDSGKRGQEYWRSKNPKLKMN